MTWIVPCALGCALIAAVSWILVVRRLCRRVHEHTDRLGLAVLYIGGNRPFSYLLRAWERDLEHAWALRMTGNELRRATKGVRVIFIPCARLRPLGMRLTGLDDGATAVVGCRELRDSDDFARPDWSFTRQAFLHEVSHIVARRALGMFRTSDHHALFREIRLGG